MCNSNRRLDNGFNILEGVTKNPLFLGINLAMCGLQVLIIFVAGPVFQINTPRPGNGRDPQGGALWAIAIILGFLSIPFGMIIRLVPDAVMAKMVPSFLKNRTSRGPNVLVSDPEAFQKYPPEYQDVRDELEFIKMIKGGRLTNLKFAIQHPRQRFTHSRNSSYSRMSTTAGGAPSTPLGAPASTTTPSAVTPTAVSSEKPEAAAENAAPAATESRRRSRSTRSRANSALGAPTVMAGIIAAGVAASWSPVEKIDDDSTKDNVPR